MLYWSPLCSEFQEWEPKAGWNATFSELDKLQCMNLFFFFKKKYDASQAEILAQMIIYKKKYHGLKYSEEQEASIHSVKALIPA